MRKPFVLTATLALTAACNAVITTERDAGEHATGGNTSSVHTESGGNGTAGSSTRSIGGSSAEIGTSSSSSGGGSSTGGTLSSSDTQPLGGSSSTLGSIATTTTTGGTRASNSSTGGLSSSGGASTSTAATTTGGVASSGGASSLLPTTGGVTATGGITATGGATNSACPGQTKDCNGSCIPINSCCGGCSGNTPVCNNGTCVGKPNGDHCETSAECVSNTCADNVCCNVACDGQCEACNLSASKGTCTPSDTSRASNPCTGEGTTCGGTCDGTAEHRKACVYPSSSTLCGPGASCNISTNQATAAQVCNGSGACTTPAVKNCGAYGCNSNATACSTGCASASQGVCSGSCVDIMSDPAHCGGSCQVCPSTTPRCSGGTCVQCTVGSDCSTLGYGSGSVCASNHTCQCHPASSANILQNAGFNGSLSGWTPSPCVGCSTPTVSYETYDLEGCPGSGSLHITYYGFAFGSATQCVPVKSTHSYRFGFAYRQTSPNPNAVSCSVEQYVGSTCSGDPLPDFASLAGERVPSLNAWDGVNTQFMTADTAGSVMVSCGIGQTYDVWVDQIYLNESGQYF